MRRFREAGFSFQLTAHVHALIGQIKTATKSAGRTLVLNPQLTKSSYAVLQQNLPLELRGNCSVRSLLIRSLSDLAQPHLRLRMRELSIIDLESALQSYLLNEL